MRYVLYFFAFVWAAMILAFAANWVINGTPKELTLGNPETSAQPINCDTDFPVLPNYNLGLSVAKTSDSEETITSSKEGLALHLPLDESTTSTYTLESGSGMSLFRYSSPQIFISGGVSKIDPACMIADASDKTPDSELDDALGADYGTQASLESVVSTFKPVFDDWGAKITSYSYIVSKQRTNANGSAHIGSAVRFETTKGEYELYRQMAVRRNTLVIIVALINATGQNTKAEDARTYLSNMPSMVIFSK